jgi:hypothetical protein
MRADKATMHSLRAAFVALALTPIVVGHTWVDQLRNINAKGEYVGDAGYSRHKLIQGDPQWNYKGGDGTGMQNLVPNPEEKSNPFISNESFVCHPLQRKPKQTANYPRLQTAPGTFMAMRYLENGHVSLVGTDTNRVKDPNNGTIYIFGTTEPKNDEKLFDVLQWTKDGKGGDKRGVLLSAQDFDDGRCHQGNLTPVSKGRSKTLPNYPAGQVSDQPSELELPCESDVMLPKDATVGKAYTLYWVWQWGSVKDPMTLPDGKDEYYTTCIDVDVVDKVDEAAKLEHPMYQQDAMSVAVSKFASRTAMAGYDDPIKGERSPTLFAKLGGGSGGSDSPATAAPSATKPSAAPTTLSTVTTPAGSKPTEPSTEPSASVPEATGIPTMKTRPGRIQPTNIPAGSDSGSDKGDSKDAVTVTDTVVVTVTAAPAVTTTPLAKRAVPHGAKFRGTSPTSQD